METTTQGGVTATRERTAKRVTLSDVARTAGVSPATASKALSGRHDVGAATKARVVEIAKQLNFRPNRHAQTLASGRSGTVGLVTHDLEGRFSIPILLGAEDAFGSGRVSVMLCDARGDLIREQYHVGALIGRQVDGLIVVGARPDPRESLGPQPVPVVYAYAPSTSPDDMSIIVDNHEAGRLAIEHLIYTGRRNIAVIGGDISYGAATDRVEGAEEALRSAGLEMLGGQALFGAWSENWGRGATSAILDQYPNVDAILCGSDQIARGALETLRERGLRVPEDVAVIGNDNWEVLAAGARPSLTSIDMNLEQLGRRAATLLLQAIAGQPASGIEKVHTQLVVRGSTAQ